MYKFTLEDQIKGGKTVRGTKFDRVMGELIEKYMKIEQKVVKPAELTNKKKHKKEKPKIISVTNVDLMVQASIKEFIKGNSKPFQLLVERAYKKPTVVVETTEIPLDENPVYTQMKEMTDAYKDDEKLTATIVETPKEDIDKK